MLLPYRAKNPPERFPIITVSLIVLNTLVFALTSQDFLSVRESAVLAYAVSHSTLSPVRLLTSMFLHASLLHLVGNMLFLWIFGAAVEGRLRPLKFMAVYLISGMVGGLLSDVVMGLLNPDVPSLGASGAIMGLAGAYLYMFPFAPIRLVWFFWFGLLPRGGVTDWQARWVILYFVGLDILNGVLLAGADGVAHFAHLGGAGAGLLAVFLLRAPRDNEDFSRAQAVRADMRDFSLMTLQELEALMQQPTQDMRLVMAYCEKALVSPFGASEAKCLAALQHYGAALMEQAEPNQLTHILMRLSLDTARKIPMVFFLRLGSKLERTGSPDSAYHIYRRIGEISPQSPDAEVALYRVGRMLETVYQNRAQAVACYTQMLQLYPNGQMRMEAQRSLQLLSTSHV